MNHRNKTGKDENFFAILNAAVALDIRKGHLKWTITQLSLQTGISRTLIYYYFGKSKLEILKSAMTIVGHEILGFSQDRLDLWNQGKYSESFILSREMLRKNPELIFFYFYNRNKESELGDTIQREEKLFLKKIQKFFPNQEKTTHESLKALFLGIACSPELSNAAVHEAFSIILNGIRVPN